MKRACVLLFLLLIPLLSGCFGAAGKPLPMDQLSTLRAQFEKLDRSNIEEVNAQLKSLQAETEQLAQSKDRALKAKLSMNYVLMGYCWERKGELADAQRYYGEAAGGEYGSVVHFRQAQVAEYRLFRAQSEVKDIELSHDRRVEAEIIAKEQRKLALSALERAANYPMGTKVLWRDPTVASLGPGVWRVVDARYEANFRLDKYYRDTPSYQVFDFLVRICGGSEAQGAARKSYPYILVIVLIAVLAKIITTPLSAAQFKSMRQIQVIQPELKKIQEKYKGDKAQLGRAQMELFKEHKINPASSCLPMLIQMPILIWVYYGIRHFIFRFEGVRFLYLDSLANPDTIAIGGQPWPGPLLILYGISMYFSQKLLSTPAATPEQQQQQKLMTYMMPVMLLIVLKGLPAAFILYWLLQNILMTGHQYLIIRPHRMAEAAASGAAKPLTGPPPEVIEKLSQEPQSPKKKKKRR